MNLQALWPYVCLIGGGCLSILGIVVRKKLEDSNSWPKVSGTIITSTAKPGTTRIGSKYIYVVCPQVIYKYEVEGTTYTSSQLALIEMYSANEQRAQKMAEKYPAGQTVEVYYNPKKPETAVLQVGDSTQGVFPSSLIIMGIVIFAGGIIWLFISLH